MKKKKLITKLGTICIIMTCFSCGSNKNTTDSKSEDATSTAVFFKSVGNEPNWYLELSEQSIVFKHEFETITAAYVAPIEAMDSNVKLYRTKDDANELSITIKHNECTNPMDGKVSPYKVTVELKSVSSLASKKFDGCGEYITDYRLNDIWVLETLNGKKADVSRFRDKLPSIEINSATNTFSGFAGCNSIAGKLFFEKGLIRFIDAMTTMIYCDDNDERPFMNALSKTTTYKIENNRLWLSNPSGVLVVFKKVD